MAMTLLFVSPSVAALDKPPKHDCEMVSATPTLDVTAISAVSINLAAVNCEKQFKETATSYVAMREGVGLSAGVAISNIDNFYAPTMGLYTSSTPMYRRVSYTLNPYDKPLTYFAFPRSVRILIRHLADC